MNDNSKSTVFSYTYSTDDLSYYNIRFAFDKLLGSLATATAYSGFGDKVNDYTRVLKIVSKWSADFEEKKTLVYIDHKELLSMYYKVEELNDELNCKVNSEISDQIVIWLWEIMLLRKKQIDNLD